MTKWSLQGCSAGRRGLASEALVGDDDGNGCSLVCCSPSRFLAERHGILQLGSRMSLESRSRSRWTSPLSFDNTSIAILLNVSEHFWWVGVAVPAVPGLEVELHQF